MKLDKFFFLSTTLLALSGQSYCATATALVEGTKEDSEIEGVLEFEDTAKGLKITGSIENVPSGDHGFHIHEFGGCEEEGKQAGSHFNPDHKPHGHMMKNGAAHVHPGDMGNVMADEKGHVTIDVLLPKVTLTSGKYAVAGRAVILHENKDDFSQPTGNAGGRIGCGPILLTGK